MEVFIHNIKELKDFAHSLIPHLKRGSVICLRGDLGVGKTTFTRNIIQFLLKDNTIEVTSPTFNLVQVYGIDPLKIWHFDLYRLKHFNEVYELGIEEAFNDIAIIEWPEIISSLLPIYAINITLKFDHNSEESRIITYDNLE